MKDTQKITLYNSIRKGLFPLALVGVAAVGLANLPKNHTTYSDTMEEPRYLEQEQIVCTTTQRRLNSLISTLGDANEFSSMTKDYGDYTVTISPLDYTSTQVVVDTDMEDAPWKTIQVLTSDAKVISSYLSTHHEKMPTLKTSHLHGEQKLLDAIMKDFVSDDCAPRIYATPHEQRVGMHVDLVAGRLFEKFYDKAL